MMDTYVDEAGYVPMLYTDADYVALWNIVRESDMNKEYSLICLKKIRMI